MPAAFTTGPTNPGGATYNSSSSSGGGGYTGGDPFATPAVPDWLTSGEDVLQNELSHVDSYYNVNKYLRNMNRSAQNQFAVDLQQGQSAAAEELARSYQDGTYGKQNSAMIAAQTALPGQTNLLNTKTAAAGIALDAQEKNQQARAMLAKSIADARSQYSNTLAQYITGIRGQNIQGALGFGSQGIQQQGVNNQAMGIWAQLLNNPKIDPAVRAYAMQQLGIPGGGGSDRPFAPGYIPNAGPIEGGSNYGNNPTADLWWQ